jgi:hypothetical protein
MRILCGLRTILIGAALLSFDAVATPVAMELGQADLHLVGRKGCQFVPPVEWLDSTVIWEGACQSGKAHGQGVLRSYKKGASTLLFFGNLEQGELTLGVIDSSEGYIAGQFSHGKLVENVERNIIIRAFSNASAAAKAYSQHLKLEGNEKSAGFYLKKAQELEQQMD